MSHDLVDVDLVGALVGPGPGVVSQLEANTPTRFRIIEDFPDYHPEHPGARPGGGRSLKCLRFPFTELGEWPHRATVGPQPSGNITMNETSLSSDASSATSVARGEVSSARCSRAALTAASNRAPAHASCVS